jgi:hypothetical protein
MFYEKLVLWDIHIEVLIEKSSNRHKDEYLNEFE